MKLRSEKLTQPTLTDEFRPYIAPPAQVQKIRRAALLSKARQVPAGTRHNDDPWRQGEKTAAVDRLMAGGMSKADAYRRVGW